MFKFIVYLEIYTFPIKFIHKQSLCPCKHFCFSLSNCCKVDEKQAYRTNNVWTFIEENVQWNLMCWQVLNTKHILQYFQWILFTVKHRITVAHVYFIYSVIGSFRKIRIALKICFFCFRDQKLKTINFTETWPFLAMVCSQNDKLLYHFFGVIFGNVRFMQNNIWLDTEYVL